MKSNSEVENLFNAKAGSWNSKYQPGGPLASRAAMFMEHAGSLLSPNDRVLDFGCGTGAIASMLAERGYRVTACDVAGQMIDAGRQTHAGAAIDWHLLPSDWKQLPFASNAFDAVVASSVFEYLADIEMTFAECWRVLNPGGYLIATVPNPRKFIRKLEAFIRPVAIMAGKAPGLNRISKLNSYATYLKCSRNRMPLDEWFAIGGRAWFEVVDRDRSRVGETALAFLVFRKPGGQTGHSSNKQTA